MNELKTLKIRKTTHNRLLEVGKKGETFSDIIDRLINYYKEKEGTTNELDKI